MERERKEREKREERREREESDREVFSSEWAHASTIRTHHQTHIAYSMGSSSSIWCSKRSVPWKAVEPSPTASTASAIIRNRSSTLGCDRQYRQFSSAPAT